MDEYNQVLSRKVDTAVSAFLIYSIRKYNF